MHPLQKECQRLVDAGFPGVLVYCISESRQVAKTVSVPIAYPQQLVRTR
jgi:hypothetical protein